MFGIFAISLYLSRLEHVDIWLECYGKSCIACINCINCMTFGNGFPDEPSPEFQVCLVISPNPIDRDLCNSGFANEQCTLAELTTPPRVFPQAHQTMPHGLWLHYWLGNCPAMWRNALEYARSKRGFSPEHLAQLCQAHEHTMLVTLAQDMSSTCKIWWHDMLLYQTCGYHGWWNSASDAEVWFSLVFSKFLWTLNGTMVQVQSFCWTPDWIIVMQTK